MDAVNATSKLFEANGTAYYIIEGGVPLRGEVRLSGAKNAVSKLMMASLLTEDRCIIRNAPRNLGDVTITERVLQSLGTTTEWPEPNLIALQTELDRQHRRASGAGT